MAQSVERQRLIRFQLAVIQCQVFDYHRQPEGERSAALIARDASLAACVREEQVGEHVAGYVEGFGVNGADVTRDGVDVIAVNHLSPLPRGVAVGKGARGGEVEVY